jgi:hypothetical protein
MRLLIRLLIIMVLCFCLFVFPCDYTYSDLPSEIPKETFTLYANTGCGFVALENVKTGEINKYFISSSDNCVHFSHLLNGTTYRIYAPQPPNCELYNGKEFTINAKESSGCAACEDVVNIPPSSILLSKNENQHLIYANVFYEEEFERAPIPHAGLIVWKENLTYSELCKIVTDDNGQAYISYDPNVVMNYHFAYCCYYANCGFKECLHALNVPQKTIDMYDNLSQLPDCKGGSNGDIGEPIRAFPSVESLTIVPNNANPNTIFCFPAMLVLSLLLGALLATGRNPFSFFDLSVVTPRKHTTYTPRGVQVGIKATGMHVTQTAFSIASSVAETYEDVKTDAKASGKKKIGKMHLIAMAVKEAVKRKANRERKALTTLGKLILAPIELGKGVGKAIVTGNVEDLHATIKFLGGMKPEGGKVQVTKGGSVASQNRIYQGATGVLFLALFGIKQLSSAFDVFISDLEKEDKNVGKAFVHFLGKLTGISDWFG